VVFCCLFFALRAKNKQQNTTKPLQPEQLHRFYQFYPISIDVVHNYGILLLLAQLGQTLQGIVLIIPNDCPTQACRAFFLPGVGASNTARAP
jgi:hypothetical protein